ncbi:MAG: Mor transcription activator family protein [Candidatus Riflebacteria bacterium]
MGKATELPEIMQTVAEFVGNQLIKDGVEERRAVELGLGCAHAVMTALGGDNVYIPKGVFMEYNQRDLEIAEKFGRVSMREICQQYNITARRVYQIINAVKTGIEVPTQLDLFGDSDGG